MLNHRYRSGSQLRTGSILGDHGNRDSAPGPENALHPHPARREHLHKIRQDPVDSLLMKCIVIPERKQVKFERFAFNATPVGNITDLDMPEIGLSGHGAQTGEFRAVKFDHIIAVRISIFKKFQFCIFRRNGVLFMVPVQERQTFMFEIFRRLDRLFSCFGIPLSFMTEMKNF